MRMKLKYLLLGLCVLLPIILPILKAQTFKTIPTITLLVRQFLDKEYDLQQALLQANKQKIDAFLADDFEERNATKPGSPIPRKEWINSNLRNKQLKDIRITQMAVHDYGNIFVVSFSLEQPTNNISTFVVDVWKNIKNKSVLQVRYQA